MQIRGRPIAPVGQGPAPCHAYNVLRCYHLKSTHALTPGTFAILYMLLGRENSGGFGPAGISPA